MKEKHLYGNFAVEEAMHEVVENNAHIKRSIIPEEWKENIDQLLQDELVGAGRYIVGHNPGLVELIDQETDVLPEVYLTRLKERWFWHNMFYELYLEPAICSGLLPEDVHALTDSDAQMISNVYETVSGVDQATLVMSGGIKKHLDKWVNNTSVGLSESDKELLLTPPEEPFWTQYQMEHLRYILVLQTDAVQAEFIKAELVRKYHAGDDQIFNARMKEFERYKELSPQDLQQTINQYALSDDFKTKHFYLTLEKPRLKAIRDIVIYDNIEEHRILRSLIGISGFVFRKRVLKYLSETDVLPNEGKIYEFSDDEMLNAFAALQKKQKINMHKHMEQILIRPSGSCSSAALCMALQHFGFQGVDEALLAEMHERARAQGQKGELFSKLAIEARTYGLDTSLVHSEENLFSNDSQMLAPEAFATLVEEYQIALDEAIALGAESIQGFPVNTEVLRKYLNDGYVILLAGQRQDGSLHTVLVNGYDEDLLLYHDPDKPDITRETQVGELEKFSKTSVGSWMMAVRKDKRLVDRLVTCLEEFNEQARKYLKK